MNPSDSPAPAAPVTDSNPAPVETSAPVTETPAVVEAPKTLEAAQEASAKNQENNTPDNATTPQATDPAIIPDATPDTTTPDRGVNPDKGIDPDAGDTPANVPAQNADDPTQMTKEQKDAYYYQLRNTAKTTTEQALDARYQPDSIDDLKNEFMKQGFDDFQAQMLADRENDKQARELAEIRAEVSDLNASMGIEAVEVVSTIPWLNPAQKDAYGDGRLAKLASSLYENFVTRDPRTAEVDPRTGQPIPGTGVIIEAKLSPLQFYSAMDAIRASGASTAQMTAQRNAEHQMASVAPPTSVTTTRDKSFDSMTPSEQREYLEKKGHVFG